MSIYKDYDKCNVIVKNWYTSPKLVDTIDTNTIEDAILDYTIILTGKPTYESIDRIHLKLKQWYVITIGEDELGEKMALTQPVVIETRIIQRSLIERLTHSIRTKRKLQAKRYSTFDLDVKSQIRLPLRITSNIKPEINTYNKELEKKAQYLTLALLAIHQHIVKMGTNKALTTGIFTKIDATRQINTLKAWTHDIKSPHAKVIRNTVNTFNMSDLIQDITITYST